MALKLVTIGDHWNIIYSERPNGEKVLWDVSGNGAEFVVPADVAEIRKRAFDITNCPNLQKVFIPEKVRQIHKGAFDGFDSSLAIECGSQYKPEGYFEGERNLKLVVALVDIRHDASPLDAQMIGYLESLGHPYAIAFTKADKLIHSRGVEKARIISEHL